MMLKELNETLADHPGRAKNADLLSLHVPLSTSEGYTDSQNALALGHSLY